MKKPKDKAKVNDKRAASDYLVDVGGLSRGEANQITKITDAQATYEQVADSVVAGIK